MAFNYVYKKGGSGQTIASANSGCSLGVVWILNSPPPPLKNLASSRLKLVQMFTGGSSVRDLVFHSVWSVAPQQTINLWELSVWWSESGDNASCHWGGGGGGGTSLYSNFPLYTCSVLHHFCELLAGFLYACTYCNTGQLSPPTETLLNELTPFSWHLYTRLVFIKQTKTAC
jgi:hypothetical protein